MSVRLLAPVLLVLLAASVASPSLAQLPSVPAVPSAPQGPIGPLQPTPPAANPASTGGPEPGASHYRYRDDRAPGGPWPYYYGSASTVAQADCGQATCPALGGDDVTGCIPIVSPYQGYNFTIFGASRSCAYIGANGFIAFDASTARALAAADPTETPPGDVVAAFWSHHAVCNDPIRYTWTGTQLVVTYTNVYPRSPLSGVVCSGSPSSFTVVLGYKDTVKVYYPYAASSDPMAFAGYSPQLPDTLAGILSPTSKLVYAHGANLDFSWRAVEYYPNHAPFVGAAAAWEDETVVLDFFKYDPDHDAVTITSVGPASNGTVAASGPNWTYTPRADFNGPEVVAVTARDALGATWSGQATVFVQAVNDAPSMTLGALAKVPKNAGAIKLAAFASNLKAGPVDEQPWTYTYQACSYSNTTGNTTCAPQTQTYTPQHLAFTLTNDNAGLFAVAPALDAAGNLTFEAHARMTGTAHVTVVLSDDAGTDHGGVDRVTGSFTITVGNGR